MARGDSGRIVLEIPPEKKRRLYALLDEEDLTLKEWFLARMEEYILQKMPSLFDSGRTHSLPQRD